MQTDLDALGKVFIGGTGRSGTSLLAGIVASHPQIQGLGVESKFVVEADGIAALIPALTERFSVGAADLALLRFMAQMGLDETGRPMQDPGSHVSDLARRFGPDVYWPALDRFVAAITAFRVSTRLTPDPMPFPRHFEDRSLLIALTRCFLSDLFGARCLKAGKAMWSEKTPTNLIELDLLWEIFPEARFLHITRDPRGVLHSLMQQDWAPQDLHQATAFLRTIYIRWQRLKPRLPLPDPRFLEIRLEDLCAIPDEVLDQVAATLGLPDRFARRQVDAAQASRWQTEMPAAHRAHCERELADVFDLMGYRA